MNWEGKRWALSLDCDWLQLWQFRKWNWLSFRLLELTPEWDRSLGSVKVDIAFAGFRMHASYTYDANTPLRESLKAQLDDWKYSVSVPSDELDALRSDAAKWRASGFPEGGGEPIKPGDSFHVYEDKWPEGVPVESLGREHGA